MIQNIQNKCSKAFSIVTTDLPKKLYSIDSHAMIKDFGLQYIKHHNAEQCSLFEWLTGVRCVGCQSNQYSSRSKHYQCCRIPARAQTVRTFTHTNENCLAMSDECDVSTLGRVHMQLCVELPIYLTLWLLLAFVTACGYHTIIAKNAETHQWLFFSRNIG